MTELSIFSLLRVGEKYIGPYEDNTRRRRNLRACSSLSKNQCMRLRLPCRWNGYMCVRLTHSGGQQTVSSHEAARAACRSNQGGVDVAGGQEDAVTITEFAAMLVLTEVSE